jgi:recombinational DNA repair protein RecR
MYYNYPVTAKNMLKLPTKGTNTAEYMALLLIFWHQVQMTELQHARNDK